MANEVGVHIEVEHAISNIKACEIAPTRYCDFFWLLSDCEEDGCKIGCDGCRANIIGEVFYYLDFYA